MRAITFIIIFIIIFSIYGLTLKERRDLLEKDKKDLVDLIHNQDKEIDDLTKKNAGLEKDIQDLKLKKAWLKGRLFGAGAMRAMIISIIIIAALIVGVLIFIKFFWKRG